MQKDLVADILPPPEYIIEVHLTAFQLMNEVDKNQIESYINYETNLEKDYMDRHNVWVKELPQSIMKTYLVQDSYNAATNYFNIFHKEYVPAIQKGNTIQAKEILSSKLIPLYQKHRNYIDKIVKIANQNSKNTENSAAAKIKNSIIASAISPITAII